MDHLHRDSFAQTHSARVQADRQIPSFCSSRFGFQAVLSLVFTFAALGGLAGCSTNQARSQLTETPLISIALAQLPPATLPVSTSAQVSATVSNDPANAGVDWVAICGSAGSCGHFTPPHTASGAATTFWAPPAVPAKNTVAVTALSTTDHSKTSGFSVTLVSTVTSITITEFPPPMAPAGSTIPLSATVVGDPANLGVDWIANCGGINCTPNGFHSASGATVNFPIPDPSQFATIVGSTVTLTAFATADHSFSAIATFQVTAPISISITQPPPATMLTNATATVIAVVQNDLTNAGVNWNVSCANVPCGTITPAHTASGAPAVFTAPPGVPSTSNPVVTIVAQAAGAPSASTSNATAAVTIVLPISITIIQNVPNGTIVEGQSASLIATVTNDPTNAGVDWSCSPLGSCGTFSPSHTASGSPTTYTAPPTPTSVILTATSTADPTKTDTQAVTVTASPPPSSLLSGNFVMLLNSNNSQNGAYMLGGVITGQPNGGNDNNGGVITAATFDLADASGNAGNTIGILSPSTYTIGADGRGQIQLLIDTGGINRFGATGAASPCGSTPNCGSLTLSVVFVTPQHAMLSESDSFGTASGTLDLQNLQRFSGSISPGVYSLSLSGSEKAQPAAGYFLAGAVTMPSTTSYSYITDQSDGGVVTSAPFATLPQGFANGGFTGGNLRLYSVNLGLPMQFNLSFWAIDSAHFVVTDELDSLVGAPNVIISGYFTQQPSAPAVSGTYAFTEMGASIAAAHPQAAGGILTCSSTGTLDVVPLNGSVTNTAVSNVTCGAATNGRSLIALSGTSSSGINQFAAYPTVDQALYLIELDGGALGSSGAGMALPQTLSPPIASTALNGKYASNFNASTTLGSEAFAAQIAADGSSMLTGTGDVNSFNTTAATPVATPAPGAGFSGTYLSANDGRFPITLTITPLSGQPPPQMTNLDLACYLVDATRCMLLGLDATAPGTGMLLLQNTGQ